MKQPADAANPGNGNAGRAPALPAVLALLSAALLGSLAAGCQPADNEPGPGGVTVGEARALDEAAEMLDTRRVPEEALDAAVEPAATPDAGE